MNHDESLARPYAKALFDLALEQEQVTAWSNALALLSEAAQQETLKKLYHHPQVSQNKLADLLFDIAKLSKASPAEIKNLLLLLAHYQRLQILPTIATLFEEDRAQLEKTLHISITSAFPIKEKLRDRIQQALEIRLQRAIKMGFNIDKSLLGGAIIRAGDLVIDGSVRSKLDKLKQAVVQ